MDMTITKLLLLSPHPTLSLEGEGKVRVSLRAGAKQSIFLISHTVLWIASSTSPPSLSKEKAGDYAARICDRNDSTC